MIYSAYLVVTLYVYLFTFDRMYNCSVRQSILGIIYTDRQTYNHLRLNAPLEPSILNKLYSMIKLTAITWKELCTITGERN